MIIIIIIVHDDHQTNFSVLKQGMTVARMKHLSHF